MQVRQLAVSSIPWLGVTPPAVWLTPDVLSV